jgi:DNA-binding beta-propeller fold protein YncE
MQGATSSAVNVSLNPLNGFSGSIQVALNTLPAGVASNPASPFTAVAGASTSVVFGASANAPTGNFTVSVQGSSGALSHSANLSLAVQSAVNLALPRTTYIRTDSISATDDPVGEPYHRHIAYDPANKHVFIANRAMNRVEVFSTSSQSPVAQISVPGASSADLSADGSTVWIGTALERIVAIDTYSLRIRNRYLLAGLAPVPGATFNRPVEVLSLSNGKGMVRLRQRLSSEALLALWDPSSNSLTDLTSTAPALFQQGVGVLARTGDHSKVLAAANDSSGELALFDSGGNVVAGPVTFGPGLIPTIAANSDGSRFAMLFAASGTRQLLLLDASLKQVGVYIPAFAHGLAFSRDGKYLYLSESSSAASFVTVLDGHSAQLVGRVPDAAIQGTSSEIEEADETHSSSAFRIAASALSMP